MDLAFPRLCRHCGDPFDEGLSNILCADCYDSARRYGEKACSHCGLGLPPGAFEGTEEPRCLECGDGEYHLNRTVATGPYEGPVRIAHHAFKFEGMEHLHALLGARMAALLPRLGAGDALVPIPLSPERERERGYHPSRLLAAEVSRLSGIPLLECLDKARPTPAQVSLDRLERLRNLRGVFAPRRGTILPESPILVDDVYTTGGTLEECARTLKRAGVTWVGALVLGRTERLSAQQEGRA